MRAQLAMPASNTDAQRRLPGHLKNARLWLMIAATALLRMSGTMVWRSQQAAQLAEAERAAEQIFMPSTVTALGRLEPKGETVNLTSANIYPREQN